MIFLNLDGITDPVIRENFVKLTDLLKSNPFLGGEFKHIEEVVTRPSSLYRIRHQLGFQPKDILITWISDDAATVKVLAEETDKDFVTLNVSAACTVRMLIGRVPKRREI